MRPPKQKQPQVKKGLCRVLEHVDVDVDIHCRDIDILNSHDLLPYDLVAQSVEQR